MKELLSEMDLLEDDVQASLHEMSIGLIYLAAMLWDISQHSRGGIARGDP